MYPCPHPPPPNLYRRKYAKVEKIPGGAIEDSRVLKGVMFEKDVVVPARMRRWVGRAVGGWSVAAGGGKGVGMASCDVCGGEQKGVGEVASQRRSLTVVPAALLRRARCAGRRKIHNPRILLLDCPLEYKKGENQTNVELMREEDW